MMKIDDKKIMKLKKQHEDIEKELTVMFNVFSKSCEYRKKKDYGNEWYYECIHSEYHLREYNNILPCSFKMCPLLR